MKQTITSKVEMSTKSTVDVSVSGGGLKSLGKSIAQSFKQGFKSFRQG